MGSNVTRGQHYVWRHYLEAWETNGQLSVSRRGAAPFFSPAGGIGKQRDFYRIRHLLPQDIEFADQFIEKLPISDLGKREARGWFKPWNLIRSIEAMFPNGAMPQEVRTALTNFEIEAEEKMHGGIENDAIQLLASLKRGDTSFWMKDDTAITFSFFISVQHLRTKRGADKLMEGFIGHEMEGTIKRVWPYLKFTLASNMGLSFFQQRKDWALNVVAATGSVPFITADQPTMNLIPPVDHNDLAIYYPLSPKRALIMEHLDNSRIAPASGVMSDAEVDALNLRLAGYAHEQVYGSDRDYLADLVKRIA